MRPSRRGPSLLLLITAAVIVVFALVSRITSAPADRPAAVAAVTAAPAASPSPTEAPSPTAAPTETPTATPSPEPTPTESPAPTPTPTAVRTSTPTPRPSVTAAPTAPPPIEIANASGPVPAGSTRYQGTVTDAVTGAPLSGVCVYAGPPSGCPAPSLLTDASGRYAVDLPAGLGFSFTFEKDGYLPAIRLTGTTINVALLRR